MAEGKARYAIVRVDINCPKDVCGEEDFCFLSKGKTLEDMCDYCDFLDEKIIIGDTKEQMILKVAQVLFRRRLGLYKLIWGGVPSKQEAERYYEVCLEVAKEIVEFLGVR